MYLFLTKLMPITVGQVANRLNGQHLRVMVMEVCTITYKLFMCLLVYTYI